MKTPFGTLYTSNITPDPQTGIGMWTSDQFYQMMHNGRFPDGGLVYPAMPFASYTKVTREDSDAIYAYLRSIPPVKQINRPHDLKFPFNNRSLILGWRTLFFKEGVYKPDPTKSADWNRGAYLVEGLGHCGMCHTAINALGGSSESQAFEGGLIPMQNWYAPSLTSNKEAGLGDWTIEEISDYLRKGVSSPRRGLRADGGSRLQQPAISQRRRYPRDGDLSEEPRAGDIAGEAGSAAAFGGEQPAARRSASRSTTANARAATARTGLGMPPHYPPLAGNQSIQMVSAVNAIRMVLNGGYPPGTAGNPMPYGMPPFAHRMSDDEVAAVVTYIRTSWGNRGEPVSARQANELRAATLN